jgi:hypothetical protein
LITETLWNCPLPERLLGQFLTLASSPFQLDVHRPLWQSFEWPCSPTPEDQYGIRLQLANGSLVLIQPHGGLVGCYAAPVCYWDAYDRPASPAHAAERAHFDNAYQVLREQLRAALGPPLLTGSDSEPSCAYAIWRSTHALVIAQQAAFDIQFGIEVNLWLEQFDESSLAPSAPLIDWLTARDQARCRAAEGARLS